MKAENTSDSNFGSNIPRMIGIDSEEYVDKTENESKVFFWEKWAKISNQEEDRLHFNEVTNDPRIREVIRNFESRVIGKKVLFSEISTKNPSIKKWVNKILDSYPIPENEIVEDLLNAFRDSLRTASKEAHKYIVGVLLMNDLMLLLHSKKEPSLAELKDEIYPVDVILNPKNILRTAIIKNENGKTCFSVFEYSRRLRKGHANFWGIDPEDISWDSLGNVFLTIELGDFKYPIQLPIDPDELDEMVNERRISSRGKIRIGREEGIITKVEIFKRYMDFAEFYDFYITEKQDLEEYRKKFKELSKATLDDEYENAPIVTKYKYKDELNRVFEIELDEKKIILEKSHPRYYICFFTKVHPGIIPSEKFVSILYESIFENMKIEIWHAGEVTSSEPVIIGSLSIYNKVKVSRDVLEYSNNLLNIIQDAKGKKESLLLQNLFCNFWILNIKNRHLESLFGFIIDSLIRKDLEFEFGNEGILAKEDYLEFKSADSVDPKPYRFAEKIVNTIKGYINGVKLQRLCIMYGVEDDGVIQPLYNLVDSDRITLIEKRVNDLLEDDGFQVVILSIPFRNGVVPVIFIIPIIV